MTLTAFALLSVLLVAVHGQCNTPPPPPPCGGPGGGGPGGPGGRTPPPAPPSGGGGVPQCSTQTSPFSAADRQRILDIHNRFRSSNAQGLEQDGPSGRVRAPKGKNIYKLSYSCELEKEAQTWADRCQYAHSNKDGLGENLYRSWPAGTGNGGLTNAANYWWNELKKIGVRKYSPNYTFTDTVYSSGTGHYTQMVWGSTTELGCGLRHCQTPRQNPTSQTIIVCNYRKAGNMRNGQIYEFGNPCQRDSDCTTFPGSTCSREKGFEGLCVKH